MKVPLRLSLNLWRARLGEPFENGSGAGAIFHLPAALLPALHETENAREADAHSAAGSVRAALATRAPVVWIGGGEPLDHSEVGRVAFALNRKGRNVFVHTNGQRLRARIHEFRPDARLFLTVEFAGREEIHDRAAGGAGAFRRAIEGIRAAKLSGFHVCAHVTVGENTDARETGELFEYLDRHDVDGFVVTSGGRAPAESRSALEEALRDIRALVRCSRWEYFSRLLEASYAARGEETAVAPVSDGEAGAVEESA
jgi:MoaA/NifB/PqqE/SkfB family radical SAM enzyme